MSYRYSQFGANVHEKKVEFSVFFPGPGEFGPHLDGNPHIHKLKVAGTFQPVHWSEANAFPLVPEPFQGGTLYRLEIGPLDEGFYEYRYVVEFEGGHTRWVGDPCSKYGGREAKNCGFVVGGTSLAENRVHPIPEPLDPEDLVIYELMADDFTREYREHRSPFEALWERLPYIRDLGFNAIEFMPWTAWPDDDFNWGYGAACFFAVEHALVHDPSEPTEKLSRLAEVVNRCHELGLHVIMDGVFNQAAMSDEGDSGFAYRWLYRNPDHSPFVGAFGEGGFGGELNFANLCTQRFIADVSQYWLNTFQLDGLRLDYTKGYFQEGQGAPGVTRLIADVRRDLEIDRGSERARKFYLSIEHIDGYNAINVTNQVDATSCWYDPFYWSARESLQSDSISPQIMRLLHSERDFGDGRLPTTYVENHDHARLAWAAGGRAQWFRGQPWLIALLTSYGSPLIYNGQEFAQDNWMPEMWEERPPEITRVRSRPLQWGLAGDDIGRTLSGLLRHLIDLRRRHPALRGRRFHPADWDEIRTFPDHDGWGPDLETQTVVYQRASQEETIVVALNFGPATIRRDIRLPGSGRWQELLEDWEVAADSDGWLREHPIPSNWGRIFQKLPD